MVMNKASSSSSGPSDEKPKVIGIPSSCWCGAGIVPMLSRSQHNPCRRFYRCSVAVARKLFDDDHIFKWIDEAVVEEVEILHNSHDRVENMVMERLENTLMDMAENFVMDKLEYLIVEKAEQLVKEKVEEIVKEQVQEVVKEKVEQLVMEKLDHLVMEKIQEELLCMNLK